MTERPGQGAAGQRGTFPRLPPGPDGRKERKMAILDIIVTHRNEEWCVGRKFFEMLKLQRGVEWQDVRVLLVQDGEDGNTLDMGRIMKAYPFVDTVLTIPHGGVSAARNEGLAFSTAEWVMFCDFDDMLYSADSLGRIITSIEQAGEAADQIWSDIWIEGVTEDGRWAKVKKGFNNVFIHGRVYRRAFLEDHGIRFDEELCYSEDAMFNVLCAIEMDPKRIAKMPETVYMWCYREGSASNYEGGDPARNESQYKKRLKTIEAYEQRGIRYEAKANAARMLLDYYWELNGQEQLAGHTKEEWIAMLQRDVISRWPEAIMEISPEDRKMLWRVTREEAEKKGHIRKGMPGAEEWLRSIGAVK